MRTESPEVTPIGDSSSPGSSRRRVLALMLGACRWLPGALPRASIGATPPASSGAPDGAANNVPVRLALSESLVSDVNINDARAAMLIWIRQLDQDLHIPIEISPKVFESTAEIVRRARSGLFDAVGLNIAEYRQIADTLDPSQIMTETNAEEQYLLLVKRGGGIRSLGDLRGRRLAMLTNVRMCIAPQWLSIILDEGHFPQSDRFFGSVVEESRAARVVLPVFFGQADACITSKKSFDLVCELNPQVGRELTSIATSPDLVVGFEVFHRNYQGANRDRFAHIYSSTQNAPAATVARKQLSTLFHFDNLTIRNSTGLEPALALLEKAERIHARPGTAGRGGQ